MVRVFSTVLQMSLVGSITILVVLAARVLLRKAPRWISYVLWLVVLFRLLCPWSPDGAFSLIPKDLPVVSSTAAAALDTTPLYAAEAVAETAADMLRGQPLAEIMADVGPDWMPTRLHVKDVLLVFLAWLWPIGVAVLAIYNLISYARLKLRLIKTASIEGRVCEVEGLASPFVMGFFRPKIYLPTGLRERERPYILLHEQTHIRRWDHLWKLLFFLALTIHWFNPLVWLAFCSFVKDMEISCDEAVLQQLGPEVRADYSASLLRLATGRTTLLAFGEGDVKGRIKHILALKKRTAMWLIVFAVLLVVLLMVFLAVDPTPDQNIFGARYYVNDTLYHGRMSYSFTYTPANAPAFLIDENEHLYIRHIDEEWTDQGRLLPVNLDREARNALFPSSNNHVQSIMDDVVKVYKADDSDRDMHCYLFVYKPMHWNNYHLYLAQGHSEEEMRWLFKLDSPDGIDLEYLDFTIAHTWTNAENARCFAVYEDHDLLLAAWSNGIKTGISEFHIHDSSGRKTYRQTGGVASPINGEISCLSKHAFTRYAAFATRNPAQSSYEMRLDDRTILLQPSTIPGLAVEPVPYPLKSYLADRIAFRTAESPVGEAVPQVAVEETENAFPDNAIDYGSTTPIYDLTENAAVSISADRLSNYHFYTNSKQITVSGVLVPTETTIRLLSAATGHVGQEAVLTEGGSVTFQNLTAAMRYTLEIESPGNAVITVTD